MGHGMGSVVVVPSTFNLSPLEKTQASGVPFHFATMTIKWHRCLIEYAYLRC